MLLSQWYVPEPDIKVHLLAKDLVARGHSVTSITAFPNYPAGKIYPGYRLRLWQWEYRDGVRILRVPLFPDHSRSRLKRILNYVSFAVSASLVGGALCGPADVMWVYHPPLTVGLPAWWIGLVRGIPYVYEVADMWPETLAATGMFHSRRAATWLARLAKFIYNRAAAITVISPGFKRNLIAKGVPADKIHFVSNWADEDTYRPVARDEALASTHGMAGRFNVVFGGNVGAAQALGNVLNAAALLKDLPDVQFVLIGGGIDVPKLKQESRERGLDNVRFIEYQPADRMPHFFALADVLLVHLKRDPLFEITIPCKTIAYLACGRPILCAVPGDTGDVITDADAGLVCAAEDPEALAQRLRELYHMPAEQREKFGQSGRRAFLARYTRSVLVERYLDVFRAVANPNGRHSAPSVGEPVA